MIALEWLDVATQVVGSITMQTADTVGSAASAVANTAVTMSDVPEQHDMLHFVKQTDVVGKTLFGILVLMSVVTWYIIIVKTLTNIRQRSLSKQFLHRFWNASSLQQVYKDLHQYGAKDLFSRLANEALHANDHFHRYGASRLSEGGSNEEFITRTMRKVIDEETARLENG